MWPRRTNHTPAWRFAATLAIAIGLAAPAFAQVAGTVGGTTMVGGASGQTIRVVLCATDAGVGCTAWAEIASRDGATIVRELVNLRPTESTAVGVDISQLADGVRRRVELLPAVKVVDGHCAAAIEINENVSGRTLAYMPGLLLPASGAHLSAIGVARGQILRLAAIREFDPQPDPPACRAVLAFADATGNLVGASRAVELTPGESTFVDFDLGLLLPAVRDPLRVRLLIRPQLLLPAAGGGETRGCRVSVQLIDRLAGWTTVATTSR